MGNIKEHIEIEDKYVLNKIPSDIVWDKSVIVYQFFCDEAGGKEFVQDKLVINLTKATVSFCTVTKEILSSNKSNKKTEYKSVDEIDFKSLIGRPFVMKRRYIKDKLFFDSYVYGNFPEKRDSLLMLEIEHEENDTMQQYSEILSSAKCVSALPEYYNENMTTEFTEENLNEFFELRRTHVDGKEKG